MAAIFRDGTDGCKLADLPLYRTQASKSLEAAEVAAIDNLVAVLVRRTFVRCALHNHLILRPSLLIRALRLPRS